MSRRYLRALLVTAAAVLMLVALLPGVAAADGHITVVADGLNNPRGLDVARNGAIYVAESGVGGDGKCITGPEGEEICLGLTGSITRIHRGTQERIVTRLPSLAEASGEGAAGPSDVFFGSRNRIFATIGLGADPAARDELGNQGARLGTVIKFRDRPGTGQPRIFADFAAYEGAEDPDGAGADSNPNSIWAVGNKVYVADAGGNTLVLRNNKRAMDTLAVFPDRLVPPPFPPPPPEIPMQAVPTSVVRGPDRAFYVGELTGFPFVPGAANVYRVTHRGDMSVAATGFTNIIDIAFDDEGYLYVLEISAAGLLTGDLAGALWMVDLDTGDKTLVLDDPLFAPGGVDVARDGTIYVTNCSVCTGAGPFPFNGHVLAIDPMKP